MAQIEMVLRMQCSSAGCDSWPIADRLIDCTYDQATGELRVQLASDATNDDVDRGRLCKSRQGCMGHWHRRATASVHVRRLSDAVSTSAKHTAPPLPTTDD